MQTFLTKFMETNNKTIKVGGIKAWFLASRPKTLTGAIAPVLVGGALAWKESGIDCCGCGLITHNSQLITFLICLLFAILMQIDANFVNDWWDFKKGTDREDRLGPERACAQGWITPSAMKVGIIITTLLSCIVGLSLLCFHQQWELILVGAACVFGCFLYTFKLSYLGFGDILVLVFFGIIPVGFTYYIMTGGEWSREVTLAGAGMGLITDCLLMVNNYRDYEQDKISGKQTLVVRFGKTFGLTAYYILALIATSLMFIVLFINGNIATACIASCIIAALASKLYLSMKTLEGKSLNSLLGKTALMIFLYGVIFAVTLLL